MTREPHLKRRLPTTLMQLRALALYYDPDRPHTQQMIAEKFGVSRTAIAMRIKRAEEKLRSSGLKIPPRPGGRAPERFAQLSATEDRRN